MSERRQHSFDPQRPSPELLLHAYGQGIFPMADPRRGRIEWFSPEPRAIIPLDRFHVPESLARVVKQGHFSIRSDTRFTEVMRACAAPRPQQAESWINDRLITAYTALHTRGYAHSVEAWLDGALVGGLYGVHIGGAFFGESMFIRPERGGSNSSKVCLVHLVEHLRAREFGLLDTQFWNPHLEQFGCTEIPRETYLVMLEREIHRPISWDWQSV